MDFLAKVEAGLDVTAQEVFDHAVSNVIRQGKKSAKVDPVTGGTGYCLYRGPNGLRCAVGWCIPDSRYRDHMDAKGSATDVAALIRRGLLPEPLIQHAWLLEHIQSDHDDVMGDPFVEYFKSAARSTAADYRLEWNHD